MDRDGDSFNQKLTRKSFIRRAAMATGGVALTAGGLRCARGLRWGLRYKRGRYSRRRRGCNRGNGGRRRRGNDGGRL